MADCGEAGELADYSAQTVCLIVKGTGISSDCDETGVSSDGVDGIKI
ncbi:MAG: hypothetical protein NC400_01600 [Clostridium sp.]|nr:hypothetical protein [Clostridium sp.]